MVSTSGDAVSVAITGLACRFPGDGDSLENFWQMICEGKSAWTEMPDDRFSPDAFWSARKKRNTMVTRGAHFVKQDIAVFDANFFGISGSEASSMDPQQRIMIEVAYEALEAAGYPLSDLAGTRTGVFMGHFTNDYRELVFRDTQAAPPYSATGPQKTSLANRISWLWDLRGPSFTMDTACSSSLVALHLACQSLQTGESDVAIVGGTSLLLNPDMFMFLSGQNFLSPDGRCKSFDISANGYGRGEGFAALILKRVDDALAVSDPIRAVIRGSGSNQDGHTTGFTLPSADAQASLIESVYRLAGLGFEDTGYVEAHGTGTQAGDLEETTALARTISAAHSPANKLVVGSVKSNIGHLEAAAGIAGVVKSVLMLERGMIPPNLYFQTPNPKIKFDGWNIRVPTRLMPWPTGGVRRISVNSFGYGGTNAHAILDDVNSYLASRGNRLSPSLSQYRPLNGTRGHVNGNGYGHTNGNGYSHANGSRASADLRVFPLSAQDREGLKRIKTSLATFLRRRNSEHRSDEAGYLADLAHTLGSKRTRLQWKTFAIASSISSLASALGAGPVPDEGVKTFPEYRSSRPPRLGFVFTGQGAQWATMGMDLSARYSTFRRSIEAADGYLRSELGCTWSAIEELSRPKSSSRLGTAAYAQTLCTVLQVGLVDLLREWGVEPVAVTGHSSGEIAAAYCAGALTREDAWKVAYYRGLLSTKLRTAVAPDLRGAMMAVGLSPEAASDAIAQVCPGGEVGIACVNSPTSVTVSGDADGIDKLLAHLADQGTFARKLQVDTAYHSAHMQLVAHDYLEAIMDVEAKVGGPCKVHSSVPGGMVEHDELGPSHWVRNLVSPVQFAAAVQDLVRPVQKSGKRAQENVVDVLVEIGPHPALQGPSTQSLQAIGVTNMPYLSALVRNTNDIESVLALAGSLHAQGVSVDLTKMNGLEPDSMPGHREPRVLLDLPSYSWNHSHRYWTESRIARAYRLREPTTASHLVGAPCASLAADEKLWRGFVRLAEEAWVADHKIQGSVLYPAAGFLAMAIEAALHSAEKERTVKGFLLRDIQLVAAMVVTEDQDVEYTVALRPQMTGTRETSSNWIEFTVSSSPDGKSLTRNCLGLILVEYESDSAATQEDTLKNEAIILDYQKAVADCKLLGRADDLYRELRDIGLEYGPAFTNVTEVQTATGRSRGVVRIPDVNLDTDATHPKRRPHVIHPGTLDAVFHLAFAALAGGGVSKLGVPMVPKSIDEVYVAAGIPYKAGVPLHGFSRAERHGFKEFKANIAMLSGGNSPVLSVSGLRCTEVAGGASTAMSDDPSGRHSSKKLCSKLVWRPAVDMLGPGEIKDVLASATTPPTGGTTPYSQLAGYLKLLHHVNPAISVLEFARPSSVLPHLDIAADVLRTASYTIACPNDESKAAAQQLLAEYESVMVEEFHVGQGVPEDRKNTVDVLVAQNISASSEDAVANARLLLKPGGKLCVVEDASNTDGAELKLRNAGFQGLVKLGNTSGQDGALMIATNKAYDVHTNGKINGHSKHDQEDKVVLIQPPRLSATMQSFSTQITAELSRLGYSCSTFAWRGKDNDISSLSGRACISLLELEESILEDLGGEDFAAIQSLIIDSGSLLWMTSGDDPAAAMIQGLARVVRNEEPGIRFRTLHASIVDPDRLSHLVARVFHNAPGSLDNEFLVRDGVIQVSRVVEDDVLGEQMERLDPAKSKGVVDRMPLKDAPGPLKLAVGTVGILDSLCFERDDVPNTDLKSDEIEIQVKATALNFREIMVAMGQIPDQLLGFDSAGVVLRVGSDVTKFHVGDKVAMYGHGAHRTIHRAKATFCAAIPEGLSFEQAATIPVVHGTAWYALVRLARVRKGQSVLIHAAAGGVGQAAIQIAQHYGMEIFATVGSEAKRQFLRDEYGLADDHIFHSRDLSFADGVKRMTGGRGVDVVLNSLAGEALRRTWYCVAPFGYFIEIGLKDILGNTRLDMQPFGRDATFSFFNLNHIERERPDLMAEIIAGAFDLQQRGITRPITPLVAYPVSEAERAFRLMQTGQHRGKIALTFDPEAVVPVARSAPSLNLQLDGEAAYVLVGGLGGLGRALATMLADQGARKICFLSRSGATSAEAKQLVADLESRDDPVRVGAYKCDIADASSLNTTLARCRTELGPIRGVVQCAMVLRDVLFRNMTHQQWAESTRPKVQGTHNLHAALPENLDFFIVLSSFAAIFGNRGQANYAAAGAYQDAVAHQRRGKGQRAVTIDVGQMRDIGVLAERGMTESLREWEEPYGIRAGEFLDLMRLVIAKSCTTEEMIPPQVLTGLATGGSAILAGIPQPFYLADDPKFAIMSQTGLREAKAASNGGSSGDKGNGAADSIQSLLAKSTSLAEAADHVANALVDRVARMMQLPSADEMDTGRPLNSYGIDSLAAIEIVNWALKELRSQITVFDVMAAVPISVMAGKIAGASGLVSLDGDGES